MRMLKVWELQAEAKLSSVAQLGVLLRRSITKAYVNTHTHNSLKVKATSQMTSYTGILL